MAQQALLLSPYPPPLHPPQHGRHRPPGRHRATPHDDDARRRAPDVHLVPPGVHGGAGAMRTAEHDAEELQVEEEEEARVLVED